MLFLASILICLIFLLYFLKPKVLIAIVTIDRDAYAIPQIYDSLKNELNSNTDLLIICRESDKQTIEKWTKIDGVIIRTVPHYEIKGRHNYEAIALKRNIAREYAISNNYDYLLFIDSDVIIQRSTIHKLIYANVDICLVPYGVKWLNNMPAIGVRNSSDPSGYSIKMITADSESDEFYENCAIGGMGCTLLNKKAMKIPFKYGELKNNERNVFGEDIGYFMAANDANLEIKYLANHPIKHL